MSKDSLISLLDYNPISGIFSWKSSPRIGIKAGSVAGNVSVEGYIVIGFKGKSYKAHRLAWEMHFGSEPAGEIDHIDRVKSNNSIENLRSATGSQNKANKAVRRDSKTGVRGVEKSRTKGKWIARIRIDGQNRYLGTYSSAEDAGVAYMLELERMRGEYASC